MTLIVTFGMRPRPCEHRCVALAPQRCRLIVYSCKIVTVGAKQEALLMIAARLESTVWWVKVTIARLEPAWPVTMVKGLLARVV